MKRSVFLVISLIFVLSGRAAFGQGDYLKTGQNGVQFIGGVAFEDDVTGYVIQAGRSFYGRLDARAHYLFSEEGGNSYGIGADMYILKQDIMKFPLNFTAGVTYNILKPPSGQHYFPNGSSSEKVMTFSFGIFSNWTNTKGATAQPFLYYGQINEEVKIRVLGGGLAWFIPASAKVVYRLELDLSRVIYGPGEKNTTISIAIGLIYRLGDTRNED